MCTELGGEMMRRRLMMAMGMEDDEVKEVVVNDLLCDITIPANESAWTTTPLGVTIGDLRKYKRFSINIYAGSNIHIGKSYIKAGSMNMFEFNNAANVLITEFVNSDIIENIIIAGNPSTFGPGQIALSITDTHISAPPSSLYAIRYGFSNISDDAELSLMHQTEVTTDYIVRIYGISKLE